jgi:hypothetical protein
VEAPHRAPGPPKPMAKRMPPATRTPSAFEGRQEVKRELDGETMLVNGLFAGAEIRTGQRLVSALLGPTEKLGETGDFASSSRPVL